MPTLALTRRFPDPVEVHACRYFTVIGNNVDAPWTCEQWASCDADVIMCTVTDRVNADVIASLSSRVRLLANFGVGVSHIDLDAARAHGIAVSNTPDVLTDATADIAVLLMLGAARRAGEGEALMRARAWQGWAPTSMLGTHLGGKTLGIYGMGRIGEATALRAIGFGMRIVYHGRRERTDLSFDATFIPDQRAFWSHCQFLSLHAPLTDATRGLIGEAVIYQLPLKAIIVNTARGELIDDNALIRALASRRIAAAGLDVFSEEPAFDARYATLPNTFLLPHLGSATLETRTAMGLRAVANAEAFCDGRPMMDQVI